MWSSSEAIVRTVLGDVPAATLGHTQCHEHIWLQQGPSFQVNPALCMDNFEASLQELVEYAQAGGGTIVDAQPGSFGRDAAVLRRLSEKSGVHIVAVTGFHKRIFLEEDNFLDGKSETELCELFVGELEQGVQPLRENTMGIRAGIIKVALEPDGGPDQNGYGTWFAAAARAAAETGAPVLVHTEKGADLLGLVRYFGKNGVQPDQMIFCHLDRMCPDLQMHKRLAALGCFLCYDSVHRLKYISQEQEVALLSEMVQSGYSSNVLLSLDTTAERLRAYGAKDMGLDYILQQFLPVLREAGIDANTLEAMCSRNAARALTIRK